MFIPNSLYKVKAISPFLSLPIFEIKFTLPLSLAAAIAWFDPFPPGPIICCEPRIVCPFSGIALDIKQRSATNTPKTEMVFIF